MGIIAWIVLGGVAGWLASKVAGTDAEQGVFLNIIVGIIGAIVGGFLMHLLGSETSFSFNLSSFLVAFIGAVIFLFAFKAITNRAG